MSDVCLKTRTLPLVSRKDKLMTLPGEKASREKKIDRRSQKMQIVTAVLPITCGVFEYVTFACRTSCVTQAEESIK